MIKLIIIDDKAKDIKDLVNDKTYLSSYAKEYFDFSTIEPINQYNCGDYSKDYDEKQIIIDTQKGIKELLKDAQAYIVLMDYQLCLYEKDKRSEADWFAINQAAHKGVIDAIIDCANVYLMLYTAFDPGSVSRFYESLVEIITDPKQDAKMHLFHRMLSISFEHPPINYDHVFRQTIIREIKLIEEGETDNGIWPTAVEFCNDRENS